MEMDVIIPILTLNSGASISEEQEQTEPTKKRIYKMFKNPFRKKESQPEQKQVPEIFVPVFLRNSDIAMNDSEIITKYFENIFANFRQEIILFHVFDVAVILQDNDIKNSPGKAITSLEAYPYWSSRVKRAMDVIFLFRQENKTSIIEGETVNVRFIKSAFDKDSFWVRFTKIEHNNRKIMSDCNDICIIP